MKRPIFFIISAVVVFALILVWVYVLFFNNNSNTPEDAGTLFPTSDTEEVPVNQYDDSPVVDVSTEQRLQQLVLEPVIGFQEVRETPSSTPKFYYIKSGVGHVVSVDMVSGEEKTVSGTTIPSSRVGAITPDGRFALVQSDRGSNSQHFILSLSTSSAATVEYINESLSNFVASSDNTFLYTTRTASGLVAKQYYPISKTSRELFKIPFREAVVAWGNTPSNTHYVYPKTSSKLEGYLYASQPDGSLKRLNAHGFGLSAAGNGSVVLYSKLAAGVYKTHLFNTETNNTENLTTNIMPDKCVSIIDRESFICATSSANRFDQNTPDDWYQGLISYSDNLFEIKQNTLSAEMLVNITDESGRELDITNLKVGNDNLYFTDKNDQSVWMFKLNAN